MRIFVLCVIAIFLMSSIVSAEVSLDKAFSLYQEGKFKSVAKYLTEYLEKNPDPYAYYLLGYACYKMKKHSEAIGYFREAYILDPNFSPVSVKR